MWNRLKAERYLCGLDIGGHTLKAALMDWDRSAPLVGVTEVPTRGFRDNSVTDLGELAESMDATLRRLLDRAGVPSEPPVVIGVGGGLIVPRLSTAVIPLQESRGKIITHKDKRQVLRQARFLGARLEESVIEEFAQDFIVDETNRAVNPVGLYGRKLQANLMLLLAQSSVLTNLSRAVNQAGFDVRAVFSSSLSAAQMSLSDEQKKKGTIFVDMGGRITDILFFEEGILRAYESMDWGSNHITNRLARQLGVPRDLAETIKMSYGAVTEEEEPDEEVLIRKDEGYCPVSLQAIRQSVYQEVTLWLDAFIERLCRCRLLEKMNGGIVMSGAGSLLPGLPEKIEQVTHMPVELGTVRSATQEMRYGSKFLSAVGVLHVYRQAAHSLGPSWTKTSDWGKEILHRFRELYHEYF